MSNNKKVSKIKVSITVLLMLLPSGSTPQSRVSAGFQPPPLACTTYAEGASS